MRIAIRCVIAATLVVNLAIGKDSGPAIRAQELPPPAAAPAIGPAFAGAPDGTVWLTWVEPGAASTGHAQGTPEGGGAADEIRFSTFDPAANAWRASRTIASGPMVAASAADFPQLAIDGDGRAFAIWTDGHGGASTANSHDRGATWSKPVPWKTTPGSAEMFSLAGLGDGRVLATWLDGRGQESGGKTSRLFARLLGASEAADQLIDASVCDGCRTTLAPFLDGGALVAYRGRTADKIGDIMVARFDGSAWAEPRRLSHDGERVDGRPANGPRIATDGSHVASAWSTQADSNPRVLVSFSPDAGTRWLMPLRVDQGHPDGHVDVVLLRDGALLVTWGETDGSLWLRRVTPDFTTADQISLAPAGAMRPRTFPRIALLSDYAGGQTAAQLLVVFTAAGKPSLRTLTVTVPEGDLVEAERHCDCAPAAEQLQGFPIRGTIVDADGAARTVRVRHGEVPGVFAAGTRDFKVAPVLLTTTEPRRQFLGRIERRNGVWWLFGVRLLETRATTTGAAPGPGG